jgi:16S rRNA (uracil1498-N3)-methyltransferase
MPDNPDMTARFYAPQANSPGELIELPLDEAAHLSRVMRLKAGASVCVFNGRGSEFDGVVDRVAKSRVHVRLDAVRGAAAEPHVSLTLVQAALKSEKMDDVVRDAVMIGVVAIQPIVTARSEVALSTLRRSGRRERWERVAVASAKQCGRALVPAILEPLTFENTTDALSHLTLPRPAIMLVEPSAAIGTLTLAEVGNTAPREATLLVGPEGGWTPEEVDRGSTTCTLVTLGGRTLRADAAAVVAIAALFALWNEL